MTLLSSYVFFLTSLSLPLAPTLYLPLATSLYLFYFLSATIISNFYSLLYSNVDVSQDVKSLLTKILPIVQHLNPPENTLSPACVGSQCLTALKLESSFINLPESEGPAVLSSEDAAIMSEITDEKTIVVHFTSILNEILSPGIILVNSEEYKWLAQFPGLPEATNLKPDLFATYHGVFDQRREPNDKASELRQQYQQKFYFGVPYTSILDSIVIMEAKVRISVNDDFGKVSILLLIFCQKFYK